MLTRRQLFTWWRREPDNPRPRELAPPLARFVAPTPIDTAEPFSLEAFYAARKEHR